MDTTEEVVRRFVVALGRLERDGDVEPLVRLYADDGTAGDGSHPETYRGQPGVRMFWTRYHRSFRVVASTVHTVVCDERGAALEWESVGTGSGRPFRYRGVTLLSVRDGRITRSCAYFDPASLVRRPLVDPAPR
jgi:ketosteroid isomerase-like protein